MNKLAKGAIAGAAGIILLMGGAGSLAYWSDSATLGTSGQTITAGSLKITANTDGAWKQGSTAVDLSTFKAVPGDQLTYTQTFNVAATGNNLYFTATVNSQAISGATASAADTALAGALVKSAANFTVTGSTIAASTTAGTYKVGTGTGSVTVSFTVTFPYGTTADNSTQLGKVSLAQGAVLLQQTQTP